MKKNSTYLIKWLPSIKKRCLTYQNLAFIFVISGFTILVKFSREAPFNDGSMVRDSELFSNFGDFIGGVVGSLFSLAGFFLIYLTFKEQAKQNREQNERNRLESFETKFYKMIDLHRKNVDEISYGELKGRAAIEGLLNNYNMMYNVVKRIIDNLRKSTDDDVIKLIDVFNRCNIKIIESFIIKLSYGYFFYGIDYHLTTNKAKIKYKINYKVTEIFDEIMQNRACKLPPNANLVLGHYYRHLFQTVKFVANEEILTEKQKYEYVKLLRAQLSDFEQVLLYYNSLSVMGGKWIEPINQEIIEEMCYIARFRLVKNMPYYYEYFGIRPGDIFSKEIETWREKGFKFFEIDLRKSASHPIDTLTPPC